MKKNKKSGFSLIEVNMAVLVVGMGILVLFGLFPAGLREGENGIVDTHCALFAETVLEGLRQEAHSESNPWLWSEWADIGNFINYFTTDVNGTTISGSNSKNADGRTVSGALVFPKGAVPNTYIRYIMEITGENDELTRTVNLWVWSGEYSSDDDKIFKQQAEWYSTKYVYIEEI